jgi:hypothetical protein
LKKAIGRWQTQASSQHRSFYKTGSGRKVLPLTVYFLHGKDGDIALF